MKQDSLEEMRKIKSNHKLPAPFELLESKAKAASYIDNNIDALLFDCDGVLYRGLDAAPGASQALNRLIENGKQCFFVTNNAGVNRKQLRDKLVKLLGCEELTIEQMVSSSYSCTQYLRKNIPEGGRVHVVGTNALAEELRETGGFDVTSVNDDQKASMSRDELAAYDFSPFHPVDAVVVGLDTEFNYRKLCVANVLLQRNKNALFVSTNQDSYDLVGGDARHLPGNGSLVKALEWCSQRTAIDTGKPSSTLANLLLEEHGLKPARTMMVGDRLDTDIAFGEQNGMVGALVLTGVTTADVLAQAVHDGVDDFVPTVVVPYMGMMA